MTFTLSPTATLPPGKLHVPGGNIQGWITGLNPLARFTTDAFLIDKYEVTNKQYKTFIDNGGYREKKYWKPTFIEDGRELEWKDAIARFADRTGRPGPSTWELGDYPDGQDDYPVAGVSWYEAAAYAEFKGDALPTVYHWISSAGTGRASFILPLSNFGGSGPSQVGEHRGIGVAGTYDMAGNVSEWCWNEFRGQRYILGGAWSDPTYMFTFANVKSPFDRSSTNGFRCVRYLSDGKSNEAFGPVELLIRDCSKEKPVPENIFQVYRDQFSYDPVELDLQIESTDDSADDWTEQKVSFKAAYEGERVVVYLFLPKTARPPYQTVIVFPGSGAIRRNSLGPELPFYARSVAKGGRVLAWPIYKGTYERNEGLASTWPNETHQYVDYVIKWAQDLRRTIDYLETREDIDRDRLAYLGFTWGGRLGAIIPAVEERLKVSILLSGGLAAGRSRPEVDQINFISRVKIPVLMLNGRYDAIEPLNSAQLPMLQFFGSPAGQKRHVVYDSGHSLPRNEAIKEILNWLDEHLGPIE